jgi:quercetin dioxygenase-like cupin family protein
MRKLLLSVALISLVSGCERSQLDSETCDVPLPPPGSNEVLRSKVRVADNLEVIISNVFIPPGAVVPRHYHPGEEFLYVLRGSAVQVEEGQADRELKAGDAYVIPPEAIHAPYGGPDGGHAIVFRLHVEGQEERYLVP